MEPSPTPRPIDARIEAGDDPGPLAGLPLLVKDNEDVAGLPTTFGSLLREHASPAVRDCEAVARLRAAGAVVVGKTNLPEFAFEGFTSNRAVRRHPRPVGVGLVARRLERGQRRGPRGGHGAARDRHRRGRVDPHPRGVLWPRGPEADPGARRPRPNPLVDRPVLEGTARTERRRRGTCCWTCCVDRSPATRRRRPRGRRDPTPGPSASWRRPRLVDYGPLPTSIAALFDAVLAALASATGLPIETVAPPLSEQIDEDWFTVVGVEELTWIGRDVAADRAAELTPYLREALEVAADDHARPVPRGAPTPISTTRARSTISWARPRSSSRRTMCVEGLLRGRAAPGQRRGRGTARPPTTRRPRTSPGTRRCRFRRARRPTACRSASRSPARACRRHGAGGGRGVGGGAPLAARRARVHAVRCVSSPGRHLAGQLARSRRSNTRLGRSHR